MLSHSIGTDHALWDPQVPDLLPCFQILRYDIRGHGASDAPAGDYSIAQLGQDALSLADSLGLGKFAFCGISLGGAIGQWLASNAPARLSKLVLANTSPEFGPLANWESRRTTVLREGTAAIADAAMSRFFSPESLASSNAASVRSVLVGTDRTGYAGCCAALRDFKHTANLPQIQVATLVIGGDRDVSTPWTGNGEILAGEIPGARVRSAQPCWISFCRRQTLASTPLTPDSPPAAPSSAISTSTKPSPIPTTSTASSRTSSRATPGARSGPVLA
jgi:3-oxoadipate enol-lactonase